MRRERKEAARKDRGQFIHNKSEKGPTSGSKVTKRTRIDVNHLVGGFSVPATLYSSLPLRHPGGKSQTAGGRGTGQLHHGVNSDFSRSIKNISFA